MGDTLKQDVDVSAEEALLNVDSPLEADGKTNRGNDPLVEMHFPTELDPNRALPDNGYPYLDRKQRLESEIRRAAVEGRSPDLENPGPDASNPLRSAAALDNPMNIQQASMLGKAKPAAVLDPEDLGLVEAADGSLVQRGTVVGPGSVTETELGTRVPLSEDASDPDAKAELEDEQEETTDESVNHDSGDSSDSGATDGDHSQGSPSVTHHVGE